MKIISKFRHISGLVADLDLTHVFHVSGYSQLGELILAIRLIQVSFNKSISGELFTTLCLAEKLLKGNSKEKDTFLQLAGPCFFRSNFQKARRVRSSHKR